MPQPGEESVLDRLLKTRYPLTYYLSRQQQFVNAYSTPQTVTAPTPPPPPPTHSNPTTHMMHKRKASLPPPSCFNVPDTLDFNATEYGHHDEMDHNSGIEEDGTHEYDETLLLKDINNRTDESNSDMTNEKDSLLLKRSSAIQLAFSPYENDSPLRKAIQNGLNIINK